MYAKLFPINAKGHYSIHRRLLMNVSSEIANHETHVIMNQYLCILLNQNFTCTDLGKEITH